MMKEEPVNAEVKKRRARPAAAEEEAPATRHGRRRTTRTPTEAGEAAPQAAAPEAPPPAPPAEETAAPRRRGRTRKADAAESEAPATPAAAAEAPAEAPAEPRKGRGRRAAQPKESAAEAPAASAPPAQPPVAAPAAPAPESPAATPAQAAAPAERQPRPEQQGRERQGRHERHERQGGGQPQGQPGGGGGRRRRRRRGGGGGGAMSPQQLANLEAQLQQVEGVLEIDDRGNGRLRKLDRNFQATDNDPEVSRQVIERFHLRPGALIKAAALARSGKLQVQRVDEVEGLSPEDASNRVTFMNLTSIDPEKRIELETSPGEHITRIIDMIAPIGFGQRGLIVAPPKTGKTIILQRIAKAVLQNYPKAKLMVLLIDERPEEVTDFRRTIGAEVFGSSSDRPAYEHLRLAEIVMERARRLAEAGEDVVVLLDSITRLARAYNKEIESSGRTMSGGVDSRALERPKRLFGAARNTEEAGSLTILGTALVDTGSRMDEVIFEEFKGTGNMELVLDRQLAERRIWPAININASGTRKEEKLYAQKENEKLRKLRQYLAALRPADAMEKLLSRVRDFRSNAEFLDAM